MELAKILEKINTLDSVGTEFLQFAGWSVAVIVLSVITVLWIYPLANRNHRYISQLNIMTFSVFLAACLVFYPVYGQWETWQAYDESLRPAIRWILSALGALRLFLIGIDFDIVLKSTPSDPRWLRELFCRYAALVYIAAPILTFSNVLSLFRDVTGGLRVRFCVFRRVYILSELNAQSVAMARDIRSKRHFAVIVFADVFPGDKEEDYELLQRARSLHAICLKRDAANIELARIGRSVEFLLVGNNESENTSQAIALTRKYKNRRRKTAIYTFDSSPSTDHILDSLDKGKHLLSKRFLRRLLLKPKDILLNDTWEKGNAQLSGNFSLRRIDPVGLLVQEVLQWNGYGDYRRIWERAEQNDKTVSITILGMGSYGTEFLKTAAWFYQRNGYCVEINVIDQGDVNGDAEKRLKQACPELVDLHAARGSTEACYDIRFFNNIDCFSSKFDQTLKDNRERFLRTQVVFVSLGDDDRNIRAAMNVRMLFDRMQLEEKKEEATAKEENKTEETAKEMPAPQPPHPVRDMLKETIREVKKLIADETGGAAAEEKTAPESVNPLIYAVIYDDRRARNLNSNLPAEKKDIRKMTGKLFGRQKETTAGLVNHKKVPYDIRFVGALTERFSLKTIDAFKEREKKALRYHLDWTRKESQLHAYYDKDEAQMDEAEKKLHSAFRAEMDKEKKNEKAALWWGDTDYYRTVRLFNRNITVVRRRKLRETIERFMCFAYFRQSSMAKEFQKTAMASLNADSSGENKACSSPVCSCSRCKESRITEHMRWNAYMRAQGYRFGASRDDRAKLHSDLVTWERLPCRERYKD